MTKTGYRVCDIGEVLPWPDLRDFLTHLPPTEDSALYRERHPQSWWWTPEIDFLGAVLTAVQWGNWQRGGGRGDKPKQVQRPLDRPKTVVAAPRSAAELAARKQALKDKMERTANGD